MARTLAAAAVIAICALTATVNAASDRQDDVWRALARTLPAGSTVAVRTVSGTRVTGVLLDVDDSAITVKPKTRVPEPALRLTYDSLDDLQLREERRVNFAKYATIGGTVGAALFFWLLSVGG